MRSTANTNEYSFKVKPEEKDSFIEEPEEDEDLSSQPQEMAVSMSPIGNTIDFPRKDNVYKKKDALPFDEIESLVWRRAFKNDWKENFKHWFVYMIAGTCIGITAFGMDKLEELLVNSNRILLQYVIDSID